MQGEQKEGKEEKGYFIILCSVVYMFGLLLCVERMWAEKM